MWFLQPSMTIPGVIMTILSMLMIIFLVLPLHECAHGWVASKLGDTTARFSGRLTLNPLSHIDPFGAVALLLFGFGWAKPVPINPRNFKNPKAGMAITALAGPVSNLLAAFVGALLYQVVLLASGSMSQQVFGWVSVFFIQFVSINIGLAVFNLIPLPPLDGSKILGAFLPDRILYKFYQYETYIMLGVFVLLFTGILSRPLNYIESYLFTFVMRLAAWPFQLFL
ncbi:MAG TPA: site-2 protease family protein [Candidatus Gallacutalibacter stercoravium]|nr:site-2 protease family protein [Candidatus Gallacutalibacter stercoravium]